GSGITPVLSLIRTTLRREPLSRFTLVYANRRHATTMFQEELHDLKDRYMTRFALYNLFSREQQDVALFNGRLDGAKIRAFTSAIVPVLTLDEAFVCGPEGMIDDVCAALLECGMPPERMHVERFGVPTAASSQNPAPPEISDAVITIISDGVRRDVAFRSADRSVLEAALSAGLELPFSCKGGMCCTCRAKLLDGQVRMQKNYSLEQRDLDAGFILTCQARPLTERTTISYDER
ncbi:MAG: 2Fe-2S iron-sulfur cluster-binding protein, partial [Betaproteobacteria bacterium]